MYNLYSIFWVYIRVGKPPEEGSQEASQMPEPPRLTPFDAKEQRLYTELPPDVWAPHPSLKDEPISDACIRNIIHSFGHYPKTMTGNSKNIAAFWLSSLLTKGVWNKACITADAAPTCLSISHSLPFFLEQDIFTLVQQLCSTVYLCKKTFYKNVQRNSRS